MAESKIDKGKALLKGLYGGEPTLSDVLLKQNQLTALSELNNIVFNGQSQTITENNKAALTLLLEHPTEVTTTTKFLKDNEALKSQIDAIFKSGNKENIDKVAAAIVKGSEELQKTLTPPATAPIKETAQKTEPVKKAPAPPKLFTKEDRLNAYLDAKLEAASGNDPKTFKGTKDIILSGGDKKPIRAAIKMPDGTTRNFEQFNATDPSKSPTGFRGFAWHEIDVNGQPVIKDNKAAIYFSYSGYGGTKEQTEALKAIGHAELNPQTLEVKDFIAASIDKRGGKDKVSSIHIGSGSAGASNMEVGQLFAKLQGIPAEGALFDPVGDQVARERIKRAIENPQTDNEKKLQALLLQNGVTKEQALAQLATAGDTSMTIRPFSVDAQGHTRLSNSAMIIPGASDEVNTAIALDGRSGDIAPLNDTIGQTMFLNMTGVEDKTASLAGQADPLHNIYTISTALGTDAPIITREEYQKLAANNPANPKAEVLTRILTENKKFAELMPRLAGKAVSTKDATKETQAQMEAFLESIRNNPEQLEPLAKKMESDIVFRSAVKSAIERQTDPSKSVDTGKLIGQFQALINLAKDNPELLDKAIALQVKAESFKSSHPELAKYAKEDAVDLAKLTPEMVEQKTKLLTSISDFLEHHPKVEKFIQKNAKPGATDPKAAELMASIVNDPEFVAKLDHAMTSHPELEEMLNGGNIDIGKLAGLVMDVPEIGALVSDPRVKELIASSDAVKNSPMGPFIAGAIRNGAIEKLTDKSKRFQNIAAMLAPNDMFLQAIITLAAMFLGGDSFNMLANFMSPKQQQQQPSTPPTQLATNNPQTPDQQNPAPQQQAAGAGRT